MSYKILVRPEAELDLLDAITYYEEKLNDLGREFLFSIESAFDLLSNQPESFPLVYKNV